MAFPNGLLEILQGNLLWRQIVNSNFEDLDENRILVGTLGARPAFGNAGRFYYATDTNEFFHDDGAAWVLLNGASAALTTKGDVLGHDGTSVDRLPVGADGQALVADAASPLGLKYDNVMVPIITTKGDLRTHDGVSPVRLPVGPDGHRLVADSGATEGMSWQAPISQQVSATGQVSTTSASYVVIPSMTIAVPAGGGTYLVMFSASGRGSTPSQEMEYAIHQDASIISHTHRLQDYNSGTQGDDLYMAMHSQALITGLAGGETLDVRYQTDSGTFFVEDRSLVILKIN